MLTFRADIARQDSDNRHQWEMKAMLHLLNRFGRNERGVVALYAAFGMFFMMFSAGAAVDYNIAMKEKARLQAALDNGLLAAIQKQPPERKKNESDKSYREKLEEFRKKVTTFLKDYLAANLKNAKGRSVYTGDLVVKVRVDEKTGALQARASMKIKPPFTRLLFPAGFKVGTLAETRSGYGMVEVALVVDTTGSMSLNNRIGQLKAAAKDFIGTLKATIRSKNGRQNFKVAIVPYAQYVRIDTKYKNADWIDQRNMRWVGTNDYTVRYQKCWYRYTCRRYRPRVTRCYTTSEGVRRCYSYRPCARYRKRLIRCGLASYKVAWQGCVGSRNEPYNLLDGDYSTYKVAALKGVQCPRTVMPLTPIDDDGSRKLVQKIDSLNAYGSTYIPAGLIWGWRVLSGRAPYTEGADDATVKDKAVRRIIILMTDGYNTTSPKYPFHTGWNSNVANNLTKKVCDNIKKINPATGRRHADIITITFDVHNTTVKNLLKNCATLGSYDVRSGGLSKTFRQIADELANIHLSM
ncbi:MAG TPA: TadE/TadG family protein [Thermopetrobacter sp.]|nr:TadE/TadG family protein [Thermopetrobacter sp.]